MDVPVPSPDGLIQRNTFDRIIIKHKDSGEDVFFGCLCSVCPVVGSFSLLETHETLLIGFHVGSVSCIAVSQ